MERFRRKPELSQAEKARLARNSFIIVSNSYPASAVHQALALALLFHHDRNTNFAEMSDALINSYADLKFIRTAAYHKHREALQKLKERLGREPVEGEGPPRKVGKTETKEIIAEVFKQAGYFIHLRKSTLLKELARPCSRWPNPQEERLAELRTKVVHPRHRRSIF